MELRKEECSYTSCYCEENTYLLCKRFAEANVKCWALWMSNPRKSVAICHQGGGGDGGGAGKAGDNEDDKNEGLVVWDYHVVCLVHPLGTPPLVLDLDTRLEFPILMSHYISKSFRPHSRQIPQDLRPIFRVVPAPGQYGSLFDLILMSDHHYLQQFFMT